MMEAYIYDKGGNLLTSASTDYTPITAMNMPDLAYRDVETPRPSVIMGERHWRRWRRAVAYHFSGGTGRLV